MVSRPAGGRDIFDLVVGIARAGRMVIMPGALGQPVVVRDGAELSP